MATTLTLKQASPTLQGTFVRHPLALASAKAALQYIHDGGPAFYQTLNDRTQHMIDRLNAAFVERRAPVPLRHPVATGLG